MTQKNVVVEPDYEATKELQVYTPIYAALYESFTRSMSSVEHSKQSMQ